MKTMVGYTIFNKVDMLSWLLEGIVNNFPPEQTEFGICFDSCVDGSEEAFHALAPHWLLNRGYKVHTVPSVKNVLGLVGGTNKLMKFFMDRTDCDVLFTPQDDQRMENPVHLDIARALAHYGDRLGAICGRDGYFQGYQDMACAEWSPALQKKHTVKRGEWLERPYYTDGPVGYTRNLINKIGYLDEKFIGFYIWCDYGARAVNAGFVNLVMGMDVTHVKFGRLQPCPWANDGNISGADLSYLRSKHSNIF